MAVFATGGKPIKTVNYVEYLQSDGTVYLNTEFAPNQNTRMVIDVAFLGTAGNNIAGVRNTATDTTNRFGLISFGSASKIGAFFQSSSIQAIAFDNERHSYTLDKNGLIADGVLYGSANSGTFACTYPLTLFGWNNGSGGVTATASRIYSSQIYDNDTLAHDYRPCYDPEGVACMYDEVNEEYVYGVGSGEFIAGGAAA